MKETKSIFFKMRLTPEEKERLVAYAEKHDLTMSEAIKQLCYKIFNQEDK